MTFLKLIVSGLSYFPNYSRLASNFVGIDPSFFRYICAHAKIQPSESKHCMEGPNKRK